MASDSIPLVISETQNGTADLGNNSEIVLVTSGGEQETWILKKRFVQISVIAFHIIIYLVNIVTLVFSVIFDTRCSVNEGRSVVNCTQTALIRKPRPVVIVFFLTTIANSIMVMTVLYFKPPCLKFCGFKDAVTQLIKKGSFWSLTASYVFVIYDYVIVTTKNLDGLGKAMAILLIGHFAAKLLVVFCLNYVFPVEFPAENERNLARVYIFVAYWATLVLFLLATLHASVAVALDVAEKISPLGKEKTGSHNLATEAQLLFLGIKATFQARLLSFFWNKLFHGNKDLFSTFGVLRPLKDE